MKSVSRFTTQKLLGCTEAVKCVKKLSKVPEIGPITSTELVSTLGDARAFKRGRELSAFLGIVPRQHSSGGKVVLGRIGTRGHNRACVALANKNEKIMWKLTSSQEEYKQAA